MISPHTPPGTKLVVICVDRNEILARMVLPEHRGWIGERWRSRNCNPIPFYLGQLVTLKVINPNPYTVDGFVVHVNEMPGGYALGCFKVAELPKCLTDILTGVPLTEDVL